MARHMEIKRSQRWTGLWGVYSRETPGQIELILSYNENRHSIFPSSWFPHKISLIHAICVDTHSQVASHPLTLIRCSWSQNGSCSEILFGCRERSGGVLMMRSLSSSSHLVLATVPNWRFGSGSGLEPNWNRCNGFYPIKKPNRTEPAVFWPVPHFRKLSALAPIKYLSCDRITI